MNTKAIDRAFWLRLTATAVVASLSGGCAYLSQARDHAEPTAVPAMQAAQTLNPEAGNNRRVVAGLDGGASKNVGTAYAKSFEAAPAKKGEAAFQGTEGLSTD